METSYLLTGHILCYGRGGVSDLTVANTDALRGVWLQRHYRYSTLLELGEKRKDMLEKSCKKFMLFREANELQQWIHEKEGALTNEEVGSDLEQVEVLQKKFDDFQKVTLKSKKDTTQLCLHGL